MASLRKIEKQDIDFYIEVLSFLETTSRNKTEMIKYFKNQDAAPEVPEHVVTNIKAIIRAFKEEEELTNRERCVLLKAKLYLFYDSVYDDFESEITKQDITLLSDGIDKWETIPGLEGLVAFFKDPNNEDLFEKLPENLVKSINDWTEIVEKEQEDRGKKATFGKAKLILLRQKKEADAFLEGL